jgi:PAS domain-containing protein
MSTLSSTLLAAVRALARELDAVRDGGGNAVMTRLDCADDELATIEDELRQQQQEIQDLLAGVGSGRATTIRRFLAALPLATLLTSPSGRILEANAAAQAAMGVPGIVLPGKPIFAYIAQEDRRRLRSTLTQVCGQDELLQVTALFSPRGGAGALPFHLALVRELAEPPSDGGGDEGRDGANANSYASVGSGNGEAGGVVVRWVILPDYASAAEVPSYHQLEALTRLCRLGAHGSDLRSALGQAVNLCRQAVSAADEVSLLVGDPLAPTLALGSSAEAQRLDGLQHVRAAGPTFDAWRSGGPAALDGEAATDGEAAQGATAGQGAALIGDFRAAAVGSVLAVPLLVDEAPAGVLTLYSKGSHRVATLAALRHAMPFVEAAQTLIREAHAQEEMRRTQHQLEAALTSRAAIDQAKGIIMVSMNCDADEAFRQLVRLSSVRHEKVRTVAERMVNDVATRRTRLPASPPG